MERSSSKHQFGERQLFDVVQFDMSILILLVSQTFTGHLTCKNATAAASSDCFGKFWGSTV